MESRRTWLKKAIAITAGIPVGHAMVQQLMAAPVSETEYRVWGINRTAEIKVRLDSNENPFGPSEKSKKAIVDILTEANRYPFQTITKFKELLAAKEGVSPDHIAVGAGSGDLLCASGAAFGIEGGSLLSPYPTFPLLMSYGEVYHARWDKVNLDESLSIDYNALASSIKPDTKLVFVCNPNNPTGTLVDPGIVKTFCEEVSKKVTVYSDEAYLEFLEPAQQVSMIELVKQDANVIVSRTFSKIHGLAGLRLGYVVARPDLIKKIARYQMGFPINQAALAAATVSLNDNAFMDLSRTKNAAARKILTDYLDKKEYFYGKSHTNFVFFDPKTEANTIMTKLTERGIAIRVWEYNNRKWCRVSIGTSEEMKLFVKTFSEIA
jgi:histidinol-phosphate aminotransferase